MKEMLFSTIIIVLIVIIDFSTQKYTEKVTHDMTSRFKVLEEKILDDNFDKNELKEISNEIKDIWKTKYKLISFYIEHDEIDKVANNISSMISFIEHEEYNFAINQADTAIFVLEHIEDKYKVSLANIF